LWVIDTIDWYRPNVFSSNALLAAYSPYKFDNPVNFMLWLFLKGCVFYGRWVLFLKFAWQAVRYLLGYLGGFGVFLCFLVPSLLFHGVHVNRINNDQRNHFHAELARQERHIATLQQDVANANQNTRFVIDTLRRWWDEENNDGAIHPAVVDKFHNDVVLNIQHLGW
jgi:hypothetical protein